MKVKVISLPYIFQVLYVLCFTRSRYQVSVYRTNGPLVFLVAALEITGENLEDLLAYDDLFLDYFNAFLALPVSIDATLTDRVLHLNNSSEL